MGLEGCVSQENGICTKGLFSHTRGKGDRLSACHSSTRLPYWVALRITVSHPWGSSRFLSSTPTLVAFNGASAKCN